MYTFGQIVLIFSLLALFVVSGCAAPYSLEGKQVAYVTHTNPDTLWEACGDSQACVLMAGDYCEIHIPERASPYLIEHEERHCAGQEGLDRPIVGNFRR